jgi:hypothetical protein
MSPRPPAFSKSIMVADDPRRLNALVAVAGDYDFPGLVIEARGLHGSLELSVTLGAPPVPHRRSPSRSSKGPASGSS